MYTYYGTTIVQGPSRVFPRSLYQVRGRQSDSHCTRPNSLRFNGLMSNDNNEVRPAGISEDGGQWNRTCEYKAAPARDTKDRITILIVMFGLWFEPAMGKV